MDHEEDFYTTEELLRNARARINNLEIDNNIMKNNLEALSQQILDLIDALNVRFGITEDYLITLRKRLNEV